MQCTWRVQRRWRQMVVATALVVLIVAASSSALARPSDSTGDPRGNKIDGPIETQCWEHVCGHWTTKGGDAVPLADANTDGTPDWVADFISYVEVAWDKAADYGFRPPKSDITSENHGPDGRLDVYFLDLDGSPPATVYSDDPNKSTTSGYLYGDFSSYIVIENDFSHYRGSATELENYRRYLAAHEFFHTVQYAYDAREDLWAIEGTAEWFTDEVFDEVNQATYAFGTSQLTKPNVPVDFGRDGHQYGAWIFWRFLAERFETEIIRNVWELADNAPGGPNLYVARGGREDP